MTEYITYESFGALGDGVTDDMPAIVRAHDEANRLGLPVKAKPGAKYYISPKALTALVATSCDWTDADFIIDDRDCEDFTLPIFRVISSEAPEKLEIGSLVRGQTKIENPTGRELYIIVKNEHHMDYIRKGLNQDNGSPRCDSFVAGADGSLSSAVSFDFDEITELRALPIDTERLTLIGGEFTTIANHAESKYNYHERNITVNRSNVAVSGVTHLVTGELDHGAPYRGFMSIVECTRVEVSECVFTGHFIYYTIGSAGSRVPMGSYDVNCTTAANITFRRCSQTNDIMDRRYWGVFGSNFCRDMLLEDCKFSRFDAHMGVSNCTLRRCTLGWQCLNAIGNGSFVIEDTTAYGYAFVNLREDYGSTWRGDITIRNSIWRPLGERRSIFAASNAGDHDFGYVCYLPERVEIDGLTVDESDSGDGRLYVFNDFTHGKPLSVASFPLTLPKSVSAKGVRSERRLELCESAELMASVEFIK